MKLESPIQKEIMDYLNVIGAKVFRLNSGHSGRYNQKLCPPGTPDILACIPKGLTLWIEVKKSDGKRNANQIKMHKELTDLGQIVIVARSVDDVIKAISSHK